MIDESALLAAVLDRPDDDGPRMVYADWLNEFHPREQDDVDRAEFIRVQLAFDKLPLKTPSNCNCVDCREQRATLESLERRLAELFISNPTRTLKWFGLPQPWARVVRLEKFDDEFGAGAYPYAVTRRGWIEYVRCAWLDFAEHADAMLNAHPIRDVTLTTAPVITTNKAIGADRHSLEGLGEWSMKSDDMHGWLRANRKWPYSVADIITAILSFRFRDVTFHLPPTPRRSVVHLPAGADIRAGEMVGVNAAGQAVPLRR